MRAPRSATLKLWDGVRMRSAAVADAPAERSVRVPAAWSDTAAAGLAGLVAGRAVDLAAAAEVWLSRLCDLAAPAHAMLLRQCVAPAAGAWGTGEAGVVVNLEGADPESLGDRARLAADVARRLWPDRRPRLVLTGLAGMLAARGLAYDALAARQAAVACVATLSAGAGADLVLAVAAPGPIDALLGVETCGIAPALSPLDETGALSRASLAFLHARGVAPMAALAAALVGAEVLPASSRAGHLAMHQALAPVLDEMPAVPPLLAHPQAVTPRRELPARRGGRAQKVVLGGHRVFVRTGEYEDGSLGEVSIALPQGSPAVRALADCLSHVVGVALQHGAPVGDIIDALAGTRFSPHGAVEGDPELSHASSPLDYAARTLARHYAPEAALPQVPAEADEAPLLPLELAAAPKRLRLVK
jgi:hypothetical protein